jgi:hypothetical protein
LHGGRIRVPRANGGWRLHHDSVFFRRPIATAAKSTTGALVHMDTLALTFL